MSPDVPLTAYIAGGIKMSVAVSEGASCLPQCVEDDEESSVLLDLSAMFPSLDHEVIVTVLQAHEGRVEAVVDYLMRIVAGGGEEEEEVEEELQGPFNDDIGGPPEIVPSFLQEDDHRSLTESPDPLPTYEQSCMPIEPGPPPYFSAQPSGSLPSSFTPVECNCTQQHSREQHLPGNERGGEWETDSREDHSRESDERGQQDMESGPERVAQGEAQTRHQGTKVDQYQVSVLMFLISQAEEGSTPGSAGPWQHKPAKGMLSLFKNMHCGTNLVNRFGL